MSVIVERTRTTEKAMANALFCVERDIADLLIYPLRFMDSPAQEWNQTSTISAARLTLWSSVALRPPLARGLPFFDC
jgi:hypothetical protein